MNGASGFDAPTAADSGTRNETAAEWRVGDRILDQYEITGLRPGGMGIVYRARHMSWGVDVALKRPRPRTGVDTDQFIREARTWVGLGLHPHVAHCHYVRTIDGAPSIVAEYVETGCLADWISDGRLYQGDRREVLARILDIAIQTAWGLEHSHANGVLHRDVKPANILITADHTVKICDFGIAGAYRPDGETNGAYRGTRRYASPEQAAGRPLASSSDLWSFAVTVLEMLVGDVTWLAGPAAGQALAEARPADAVGAVPEALTDLLSHCLAWDPADRPAGMGEVVPVLLGLFAAETGRPCPRPPPAPARPRADELNNRALSLLDLGRPDEARDVLDEALAADPQHLEASFNRGVLRWRAGEATDDALIEDLRAAESNGADPSRARHLIELVDRERGPSSHRFTVRMPDLEYATAAALSLDGKVLLIGTSDGTVAVVDTVDGARPQTLFGPRDSLEMVRVDSSGRYVMASGLGGSVSIWELASGRRVGGKGRAQRLYSRLDSRICLAPDAKIALETCTEGRHRPRVRHVGRLGPAHRLAVRGPVSAAVTTPDARWALLGYESGGLAVWDLVERRRRFVLRAHDDPIDEIAVDPRGRFAVTSAEGYEDLTAKVWDLQEGRLAAVLESQRAPVSALAVSVDGTIALIGAGDGTVRVWDLAEGTAMRTLIGHTNVILSVDVADAASATAVSADLAGVTRIWDLSSGRCLRTFSGEPDADLQVLVSGDARLVVRSGRRAADAWTLTAPHPAPLQPCRTRTAVELSDTHLLVDSLIEQALQSHEEGATDRALAMLESARSQPGHERTAEVMAAWHRIVPASGSAAFRTAWVSRSIPGDDGDRPTEVHVTSDGAHVLSAGHADNVVLVRGFASGEVTARLTGHTDTVLAVRADPTGRFAVTGGLDATVRVWDLRTGDQVRILDGQRGSVRAVCVTPDGRFAAAAGSDATVRVWDLETGALIHSLAGHLRSVTALCATTDGRYLLAADESSVRRWDLTTGHCTSIFERFPSGMPESLVVTADGMLLTSTFPKSKVRVRDLSTNRFVGHLEHNRGPGRLSMAAIPGTRYALTADSDAVIVWRPADGRALGRVDNPPGGVRAVCASPDGQHFLTAGDDGAISVWTIDWASASPED